MYEGPRGTDVEPNNAIVRWMGTWVCLANLGVLVRSVAFGA